MFSISKGRFSITLFKKVYGVGSEDLDTLTFASPVLLRHLTFSEAKKMPIKEIFFDRLLRGLEMSYDQVFII
jgi:flap endonuclease-1